MSNTGIVPYGNRKFEAQVEGTVVGHFTSIDEAWKAIDEIKFYVVVRRDHKQVGLLLGPYHTRTLAAAMVHQAKKLAEDIDPWTHFDSFGTSAVRGHRKPGKLNERLPRTVGLDVTGLFTAESAEEAIEKANEWVENEPRIERVVMGDPMFRKGSLWSVPMVVTHAREEEQVTLS